MAGADPDLRAARAARWWQTGRPVRSLRRAQAFLEDLGFALLFPKEGVPSLWEASADRSILPLGLDWGPDAERVWAWKGELSGDKVAWYGRFVRGRPSFLTPALLADLYPWPGEPEDYERARLSDDARRVARILLRSGELTSAVLREAAGMEGRSGSSRFSSVLTELGRTLLVTYHGTEDEGSGWPSSVLELTPRVFAVGGAATDPVAARQRAALRFLDTMVAMRPHELGNAFGWRAGPAREVLDALTGAGEAVRDGAWYRPVNPRLGPGRGPRGTPRGGRR